jgi:tetratricopeptide (TPR) repeat protein
MNEPSLPDDEENPAWDEVLALRRAGRPEEARAALERLCAADQGVREHGQMRGLRALIHADLADLRALAGDVDEAIRLLEQALADAPRFPDLHHRLGLQRLRARDVRGARAAFEQAVRLAPGYAAPRLELALLEARDGRLGESLELLRRLAEGRAARGKDDFEHGLKRLAEADWEGGGEVLRRAFGLAGDDVDGRLREISARVAEGRSGEALALARVVLAAHPQFPDAHLALALVRRERGEWDDCAESCGRALELNPAFHEARVYLAEALFRGGQYAEADAQLGLVLAATPHHPLAVALAKTLRRTPLPATDESAPH